MLTATRGYTSSSCHLPLSLGTIYSILGVISLVILCFCAAVQYIKRHGQQTHRPDGAHVESWTQHFDMEKANSKSIFPSTTMPSASACDILKPLSQNGNFPNSGAVAAKAREQMQRSSASSPTATVSLGTTQIPSSSASETNGTTHTPTKTVQQMHDVDAEGVRTWQRLIVEYGV